VKNISEYLKQNEEKVLTLKNCKLIIELDIYDINNNLIIVPDGNHIFLSSMVAILYFDDSILNVTLDYPVLVRMNPSFDKTENEISILYKKNDVIFEVTNEDTEDLSSEMSYVDRLIGGREILKDENHLFKKIYSVYSGLSGMDLVHIEVLTSQVLRDSNDISVPARLGKMWNPTLINLKETVFNEGLVQGLAFENVGKAISNGLINDIEKQHSVLEQVLIGELVEPRRRK